MTHRDAAIKPKLEHSVPWFWPYAAAATTNRVVLDLDTMRLRDFSKVGASGPPVLVDPPYAGHSSTIADYAKGQSLVETLIEAGLERSAQPDL